MRTLLAILLLAPSLAWAQIGNYPALIGQRGTTVPTTCQVGQLFFDTDAVAGSNIYGCTSANTWTAQAGGGGSGTVTSVGWTGGIVSIADPTTTPAFTIAGTSGGIPYFSSGTAWASSAALTQYALVLGGGAGGAPVSMASLGTSGHVLTSNGAGAAPTFQAPAGGAAALSGITAASAGNTIASGNNHSQIWNWALTSDSTNAFAFGETTAATNGTSTAGVPNQSILRLGTLAASTASPLVVYSRANYVFGVSPSTTQIFAAAGTAAAPVYSFAAATNAGMGVVAAPAAGLGLTHSGNVGLVVTSNTRVHVPAGTSSAAGLVDLTNQVMGLSWNLNGSRSMSFLDNTSPNIRPFEIITDSISIGTNIMYQAGAQTTGALLQFRKSRGSTASPTVITTGDDIAVINGYAYVGATGTYVEAATLTFDSDGTIANNSTGVGGVMRFATRKVAGTVTERLTVDNNETAAETSVLISINGGAPVRVSKGANDSGGAGFAVLRIPN